MERVKVSLSEAEQDVLLRAWRGEVGVNELTDCSALSTRRLVEVVGKYGRASVQLTRRGRQEAFSLTRRDQLAELVKP